MASDITGLSQFRQQALSLQEQANKTQDVTPEDLQTLSEYMSTDDAKKSFTQGQSDHIADDLSQLKMVANNGNPDGTQNTGSQNGYDHASDLSNTTWASKMDDLIKSIGTSSADGTPMMLDGIKDTQGTQLKNIPANTALATAATAEGATITPIKNSDGTANDLFAVKNKDGGQQLFGRDGNFVGNVLPKGGADQTYQIDNPAQGQDAFVKLGADGSIKTGKDMASIGNTDAKNYPVTTLHGTGEDGGYAHGDVKFLNKEGVAQPGSPTDALNRLAIDDTLAQNPGSDLQKAVDANTDPTHQGFDDATGKIAVAAQDPSTKQTTVQYFDKATGKNVTQDVQKDAKADPSKDPGYSIKEDGSLASKTDEPAGAMAKDQDPTKGKSDLGQALAKPGASFDGTIDTATFGKIKGIYVVNGKDDSGKDTHQVFDRKGNALGEPTTGDQKTVYQVTNPGPGQDAYFWADSSGKMQSGKAPPAGSGNAIALTGDGTGGYSTAESTAAKADGAVKKDVTSADGKIRGLDVVTGKSGADTTVQLFDKTGKSLGDPAKLTDKQAYEISNPTTGQDKYIWFDGNGSIQSGASAPEDFTVKASLTGDGSGGYKSEPLKDIDLNFMGLGK